MVLRVLPEDTILGAFFNEKTLHTFTTVIITHALSAKFWQ